MSNDDPEANRVVGLEPCPKCGSKDNLKRYADGHAHCFSAGCSHHEPPGTAKAEKPKTSVKLPVDKVIDPPPGAYDTPLKSRGIEAKTLRRFRYFPVLLKGKQFHVAPYYDQHGNLAFQKLRDVEAKTFPLIRAQPAIVPTSCQLFGMHAWPVDHWKTSGNRKRICCLLEGEIDAMSAAQATGFEIPCYSPPLGAGSAKAAVAANLQHLDQFDEIIVLFDNDEAGRKARDEVVAILPPEKVRIGTYPEGYKDASDLLQAKKPGTLALTIEGAQKWTPPGTFTGQGLVDLLIEEENSPPPVNVTFPWVDMNKFLRGSVRRGDVVILLAGSGVGKTTMLHSCVAHWLDKGLSVATMCFEDRPIEVLNGILTCGTAARLRLDPRCMTANAKTEVLKERGWYDRLFIEDPLAAKTKEYLYSKVRYLASVHGVDVIVVDPLSFMVSKSSTDHDERREIDHLLTEVADLGKKLNVTIVLSHHLSRPGGDRGHEDGALVSLKHARGSHAIAMYSALCLALEAPVVDRDDPEQGEPGPTRVVVLKSRWRGELRGKVATYLGYDAETGLLAEVPPPDTRKGRVDQSEFDDTFSPLPQGDLNNEAPFL